MIYPDITTKDWAEIHGLEIVKNTCENCKMDFLVDVPIAIKGYRGFEMRKHGCPDRFLSATFTPHGDSEKREWGEIFKQFGIKDKE